MPQVKHPTAAMAVPLAIHSFTVKNMASSNLLNPHFLQLVDNGFFIHESDVTVNFLAGFTIKYLGRDSPDSESSPLFIVYPNIDEYNSGLAFKLLLHFRQDGCHHLAGDTFFGPEIDHGDHAFYRQ